MPDTKKQRRFMGMVHAAQMGETPASAQVAQAAKEIPASVAKEIGSAKETGLPESAASKKKKSAPWGTTGKISGEIKKKAF